MNRVVPLRLDIAPDESLTGYLARLAEHNAYDRSTWIVLEAGEKSLNMTSWRAESLPALSELIGLPLDTVVERTYLNNGNRCNFFGQWVPRALLDCDDQKFCPDCLREHGYHSALFDLAPVWACPRHRRRLSRLCPTCARPINWGGAGLLACPNCRADLRRAKTEHLPPKTLTGLVALARRANFTHCHPAIPADGAMPPSLSHLSLGEFIELLLGLATYSGHLNSNGSFFNILRHSLSDLHLALRSGWNVLREWPLSFHDFLRRMTTERRAHGHGVYGLNRDFGSFLTFLMVQQREPWLTVKIVFRAYLANEWDGSTIRRRDGVLRDIAFKRISMTEVRGRLGRSQPKIVTLMNGGIVRPTRSGSLRGTPIFFDREDIDRIAPPGNPPLTLKGMAKRLAITAGRAKRLIDAEAIRAVSGPGVDQSKTYMILVGEVDALLSDISSHLPKTPPRRKRSRNFSSILKGQERLGLPLKPIIDAVRIGRLRPTKKNVNENGLRAFEFDNNDVKALFDEIEGGGSSAMRPRSSSARTWKAMRLPVGLRHIATRLGITKNIARRFIDSEVIRAATFVSLVGEVDALLNDISSHLPKTPHCRKRSRDFSSILKGQERLGLPLKPIIDAVRDGRLRPTKKNVDESGLRAFEFDDKDVKALFDEIEARSTPSGGLPVSLVAKQLGIQRISVVWLVGRGHLKSSDRSTAQRIRVPRTSLKAFEAKWVKVGVLAAQLATSRGLVIRALMAEGLKPIEGARVDRYGVVYFQRRQVQSVDLQKAIRKVALLKGKGRPAYQREYRRRRVGERRYVNEHS